MSWVLAILVGIGFVEMLCRLPVMKKFSELTRILGRTQHVIRSPKISDHWKEKVLLTYSGRLFSHTLVLFILFVAAFIPFLVAQGIAVWLQLDLMGLLMSWLGIAVVTIVSIIYGKSRGCFAKRQ